MTSERWIFRSREAVTLVGAGPVATAELTAALAIAPALVAADGGARAALAAGRAPAAVIGDLDSLDAATRSALDPATLHRVAEQDSTDMEKCLSRIAAPFVLALGFTGGRFDHTLAAASVLARRVGPPTVMIGAEDIVLAAPARLRLDIDAGTRVSLFPMGPVRGRSTGLRWPIDGLLLEPAGRVATSNLAEGAVTLTVEGPLLVLLPKDRLAAALAAICPRPR